MTTREPAARPSEPVLRWLLDADPAIRWQVLRDLCGEPEAVVAAERARVAREGWGAQLLARQRPDGRWGDDAAFPLWQSTLYSLLMLRCLGLDPVSEPARKAVALVRDEVTWGPEFGDSPFFEGEVEPCINGHTLTLGGYFGEPSDRLAERLVGEQLDDGGWNCEAERGSVRSSFHTTICVLEGLLAYEEARGALPAVTAARSRGETYLLHRRLLRKASTGEVIDERWTRPAFPPTWRYNVLRALDYFRRAGASPDERMAEAIAMVEAGRGEDGRWRRAQVHEDPVQLPLEGGVGEPSRWITLRAPRVLGWFGAGAPN